MGYVCEGFGRYSDPLTVGSGVRKDQHNCRKLPLREWVYPKARPQGQVGDQGQLRRRGAQARWLQACGMQELLTAEGGWAVARQREGTECSRLRHTAEQEAPMQEKVSWVKPAVGAHSLGRQGSTPDAW